MCATRSLGSGCGNPRMDLSLQVMGITGPHHRTRAQLDDEMTHLRWVPIVHTGTMCVVIEVGNDDGVCQVTLVHVQAEGVNSRWERVGADNLVRCIIAVDAA